MNNNISDLRTTILDTAKSMKALRANMIGAQNMSSKSDNIGLVGNDLFVEQLKKLKKTLDTATNHSKKIATKDSDIIGASTALMEAETLMQTAIAIREKALAAYNEILRMQM